MSNPFPGFRNRVRVHAFGQGLISFLNTFLATIPFSGFQKVILVHLSTFFWPFLLLLFLAPLASSPALPFSNWHFHFRIVSPPVAKIICNAYSWQKRGKSWQLAPRKGKTKCGKFKYVASSNRTTNVFPDSYCEGLSKD